MTNINFANKLPASGLSRGLFRIFQVLVATALGMTLLSACSRPAAGGAAIGVAMSELQSADVVSVRVRIDGPGIDPAMVQELASVGGEWQGVIGQIPAGTGRTITAEAFDAAGELIYDAQATGVTIEPGAPALVLLTLQQSTPPNPFANDAPVIDSLVIAANAVEPGNSVKVLVSAHDPDPGDTLSYAWSASAGSFDNPTSPSANFTAPPVEAAVSLTIMVTDSQMATQSLTTVIEVGAANGQGSVDVQGHLNTWPVVSGLVATPTRLQAGEVTSMTLETSDADGDALSFAWSDGGGECAGSFSDAAAQNPTWTAPAVLPASAACTLIAVVSDGRGGSTSAAFTLAVGTGPTVNVAPVITNTFQSSTSITPGGGVLFGASASDPEGQTLSFTWSAGTGSLALPTEAADSSEVTWTAPAAGCSHIITVTVADGELGETPFDFFVETCTEPCPTWFEDMDADGFGNPDVSQTSCTEPIGYVDNGDDCDDNDSSTSPDTIWYYDGDSDGFGGTSELMSCIPPGNDYATVSDDCNDTNGNMWPGAQELCDGLDNNCNGVVDDAACGETCTTPDATRCAGDAVETCSGMTGTWEPSMDCSEQGLECMASGGFSPFPQAACSTCGDGIVEGYEVCDPGVPGPDKCEDLGGIGTAPCSCSWWDFSDCSIAIVP